MHLLVHVETVGGGAGLAHVAHLGDHGAVHGRLHVGVLEHDERRVAAELHREPLQLVGRLTHQHLPDRRGPGEAHLPEPRVGHQGRAQRLGVVGGHDVEDARRETRLVEDGRQGQHRQRRQLGRLDHHRAAGRDRRADLAGTHGEREVPGGEEQTRTDRLANREQPRAAGRRLHPATVDPHGLLGEPAEELRAVRHLALRLGQRLAHLEADQLGEVVGPVHDRLEGTAQDLAAVSRGRRGPLGLDAGGGVERRHRIVGAAVGDVGDHRLVGRVVDLEPAAGARVAPLTADEETAGSGLGQEV